MVTMLKNKSISYQAVSRRNGLMNNNPLVIFSIHDPSNSGRVTNTKPEHNLHHVSLRAANIHSTDLQSSLSEL